MNDEALPQEVLLPTTRKEWLDYLGTLIKRERRAEYASGITTWALLGLAALIVYRSVPHIPRFLEVSEARQYASVLFILELDLVLGMTTGAKALLALCKGEEESRALPNLRKRAYWLIASIVLLLLGVLSGLHIFTSRFADNRFISWSLVGIGLLLAINWLSLFVSLVKRLLLQKKHSMPVEIFEPKEVSSDLGRASALFSAAALGIVAVAAIIQYSASIKDAPGGWLLPLGAATHMAVFVIVILWLLFRSLHSQALVPLENLERDILVKNLNSDDIRFRFVKEALGPSLSEWLTDLDNMSMEAEAQLQKFLEGFVGKIKEIEGIPPEYISERDARSGSLIAELEAAAERYTSTLDGVNSLLDHFVSNNATSADVPLLRAWLHGIRERTSRMKDLVESKRKEISGISARVN